MATRRKQNKATRKKAAEPSLGAVARASNLALDNPIAAGGAIVMGLTACLIIANALSLQKGRHPAPLFTTREWTEEPAPVGLAELVDTTSNSTLEVQEISSLTLNFQKSLRQIGLYEGPLDGVNGPATERSIRAFERGVGLVETGQPSEALLALVRLQANASKTDSVPVPRAKPLRDRAASTELQKPLAAGEDTRLKRIQLALSELGYGPLSADGVMGDNTTAAIKRFEFDRGLPLTGELGATVIERLEMVSGRSLAN